MRAIARRLRRGDDLYDELTRVARDNNIAAGVIACCVGCLSRARVRCAGASAIIDIDGPLEIVSVTGTISARRLHAHISLSDAKLNVLGGHLKRGCVIDTTAEIVILPLDGIVFDEEFDMDTGYGELKIIPAEDAQ